MIDKDPHELLLGNEDVSLDETEGDLKGSNGEEDYEEEDLDDLLYDEDDFLEEDEDE